MYSKQDTEYILQIKSLTKHFPVPGGFMQRPKGWIQAVDHVDLQLPRGRTLGLVGESGCGKSTLAKLILRLLDPDQGSILFQGQEIALMPERRLKHLRKSLQIVFQDPYGSLNPKLSIGRTLEDGLRVAGLDKKKRPARIKELLQLVGLPSGARQGYAHQFSGGQRQRINLARALSVEPQLIVCDEPVSALDVSIQAQIINLLSELQMELGLSYLFISHDLNLVGYLSDQVAVMYMGQIVEYAPSREIFQNPRHPYTQTLLAAVPGREPQELTQLQSISGEVPALMDPPPGCRFQARCAQAGEICKNEGPGLRSLGPGHLVRCVRTSA
ncbi:MAG: ATP-binding cassette domain-containing protein [Desulfohalobiaceae bacterium]